ncbi:polyhomeotic-like protein 2 isoform X1 [Lepisosteus oculatus]|uniref:polyhomeotic-like protein 2 isoform X1 n=3 Tax=Lepisosteus oculatus TaxID=7918 RepID=UPI00371934B1
MESDQVPSTSSSAVSTTASTSTISTSSSSSNGRQTVPQISVYSGIPDRQTVQVIQQALHRQPNTAAQYLQQMYAAQQQHLMLQTAALQQQHLNNAQLQSLAAVQQASMAAGRQGTNQNGTTSQQTGSSQTTINLATSPAAAAQLISRAQSVNSAPAGITQQAVLLGNTSGPGLTASQAQMYLRAQMAQQSNLVQVARSLGRAVPLSPQLIFTPTATVTAVQPEATAQPAGQQSATAQVQNLAIRSQQGAASGSPSQTQLQSLSLKQVASGPQPVPSGPATAHTKGPGQGAQSGGAKGGSPENTTEGGKKGESSPSLEARVMNVSRNVTSVSSHPLITPAYTQIQPHQLIQHQQHKQHQFVIQQQSQLPQRSQAQLLHTASIQPQLQTQAQPVQALTIQSALATQSQSQQCSIPVLPKPPAHQAPAPSQQATIFHSTVSPQNGHPTAMNQAAHPKPQPVQLAAVNLQIQPAPNTATRPVQDSATKDKAAPAASRETSQATIPQQPAPAATLTIATTEQRKTDTNKPMAPGRGTAERVNVKSGVVGSPPAMTSGNGNNAPTVTGSTPQNGENKPPQAIVKPQILTHVIEGFVIQEGAEPFPVGRPPLLIENLKKQKQQLQSDPEKTPQSNPPNTTDSEMEDLTQQELKDQEEDAEPKLKCELCGRVDFAYKFKRSKRFCSMACAKRYNVGCTKRVGLFHPDRSKNAKSDGPKHRRRRSRKGSLQNLNKETKKQQAPTPLQSLGGSVSSPPPSHPSQGESSQCSDISSYEEPPSPLSAASSGAPRRPGDRGPEAPEGHARELPLLTQHFLPSDPTKWNVEDVYEFIRSLPGCQEIADEFRSQEIDGQAMLLLKEDHLMSAMNIKLGPALKIYARINMLKDS